jgi:hypothetical protein
MMPRILMSKAMLPRMLMSRASDDAKDADKIVTAIVDKTMQVRHLNDVN